MRPPGWPALIPRIVTNDVKGLVAFVRDVFGAAGEVEGDRPAVLDIAGSKLKISGIGPRPATPAFLYIYVEDVDAAYKRAVAAGARALESPEGMPYGARRGTG